MGAIPSNNRPVYPCHQRPTVQHRTAISDQGKQIVGTVLTKRDGILTQIFDLPGTAGEDFEQVSSTHLSPGPTAQEGSKRGF